MIAIYITDCALIRLSINVWNTIRNKLRGIDHINSLALTPTSWSKNKQLESFVKYCKKNNKSDPNKVALPFTRQYVNIFANKILNEVLYKYTNDMNMYEKQREHFVFVKKN